VPKDGHNMTKTNHKCCTWQQTFTIYCQFIITIPLRPGKIADTASYEPNEYPEPISVNNTMLTAGIHSNRKATVACRPVVPTLWVEASLHKHRHLNVGASVNYPGSI